MLGMGSASLEYFPICKTYSAKANAHPTIHISPSCKDKPSLTTIIYKPANAKTQEPDFTGNFLLVDYEFQNKDQQYIQAGEKGRI